MEHEDESFAGQKVEGCCPIWGKAYIQGKVAGMEGDHDVAGTFFHEHGGDFSCDLVIPSILPFFFKADANFFLLYHGESIGFFP